MIAACHASGHLCASKDLLAARWQLIRKSIEIPWGETAESIPNEDELKVLHDSGFGSIEIVHADQSPESLGALLHSELLQNAKNAGIGVIIRITTQTREAASQSIRSIADTDPEIVFVSWSDAPGFTQMARTLLPRHTFLLERKQPSDWYRADAPKDPNTVCVASFEPLKLFTDQGSRQANSRMRQVKNIPYPSSLSKVIPLLSDLRMDDERDQLELYGRLRWSTALIQSQVEKLGAWSRKNHVRAFVQNIRASIFSPANDRTQYLTDLFSKVQLEDIGWSFYGWDPEFGLVGKSGARRIDDAYLKLLMGRD